MTELICSWNLANDVQVVHVALLQCIINTKSCAIKMLLETKPTYLSASNRRSFLETFMGRIALLVFKILGLYFSTNILCIYLSENKPFYPPNDLNRKLDGSIC